MKKDNLKGYRFKQIGLNWMVILLFAVLAVLNFYRIDSTSHSVSDTLRPFLLETVALAFILFLICRAIAKHSDKI